MTFDDAYKWILSLSNIPRKEYMNDPRACGWYLKRFQDFLDTIGNPEKKIPHYIHVSGTSGKGSVTSFMHHILHAAGKKVGSIYSPHPSKITERWKIGTTFMTDAEFVSIVEFLKPKLDTFIRQTSYDMVSFFELTDAIGFIFFAKHNVTHAIVEVGCGGRYDSTNVIPHKDVALITNIGLDHVGIIGNNKSQIAYEKAGIITRKTHHVITSEHSTRIAKIIESEALKQHVPYLRINKPQFSQVSVSKKGTSFVYKNILYTLSIYGEHQIYNAILCIEAAKKLMIPTKSIVRGLMSTLQPLRMEITSRSPLTILDGAHNEDKMKSTVETTKMLISLFSVKQLHIIIGFSGDKNSESMLKQLLTLKPTSIALTRNTVNPFRKVADMRDLRSLVKKYTTHTHIELFLDPKDAYQYTRKITKLDEAILATGSIFMAGELRGKIL